MSKRINALAFLVSGLFFSSIGAWSSSSDLQEESKREVELINVTIKNETSSTVKFIETEPLSDLTLLSADKRWLSKSCQWIGSWWKGAVKKLAAGEEMEVVIDPSKILAFYRVDLGRTTGNVKSGAAGIVALTAMCAGMYDLSATTTIAGACKVKSSYSELVRPGERTCKPIEPNSVIVLKDPVSGDEAQEGAGNSIVIEIKSSEQK